MNVTRRDFGKLALGSVSALAGLDALYSGALAQPTDSSNRSYIHGVQFGLQPYSYHDLQMSRENRPTLIKRLVHNGMGMVELNSPWIEPGFKEPGVSVQEAREKLRNWRLSVSADYYRAIKKEFDDAGITVFSYFVDFRASLADASNAEVDALFEAGKILGAKGCVGSLGLAAAQRLTQFPGKHGMFLGLHNHANLSDPDALSSEESFNKGLAYSPDFKAALDIRHFVAANGDCLGFLERHHQRTALLHLGDRRKDNGRSTPFGEGDAPLIQILRMIRDNEWPIPVILEFEHGTLRPGVDEVEQMFDYCKRALA